jgi:hypothetical protein
MIKEYLSYVFGANILPHESEKERERGNLQFAKEAAIFANLFKTSHKGIVRFLLLSGSIYPQIQTDTSSCISYRPL